MGSKIIELINPFVYCDIEEILQGNNEWGKFENKKFLVTGADSFIGYYLILTLLAQNDLYKRNIKIVAFGEKDEVLFLKEISMRTDIEYFQYINLELAKVKESNYIVWIEDEEKHLGSEKSLLKAEVFSSLAIYLKQTQIDKFVFFLMKVFMEKHIEMVLLRKRILDI